LPWLARGCGLCAGRGRPAARHEARPRAPACARAAGPGAGAFDAGSYSFFDAAPAAAAEALEELEPGKASVDAEVGSEAAPEAEEEPSLRPAWA